MPNTHAGMAKPNKSTRHAQRMFRSPCATATTSHTTAAATMNPRLSRHPKPAADILRMAEKSPDVRVAFDQSVAQPHNAAGVAGDVLFVRDHDDRIALFVQLLEQLHDLFARFRVE